MRDEVDEMSAGSRGSVANRMYWKTNEKRWSTNMSGEWIPVAERLPIERQHVLVWRAGAPWPDRAVLHNGKWQIASRSWLYTRVTHWMNFPAPPSDGK